MTTTAQSSNANVWIYDVDSHVIENEGAVRAYMEEPYSRRQGPLLPYDDEGGSAGGRPHAPDDLEARLAAMDEERITETLVFPTRAMNIVQVQDKPFARAYCRGYNDYVADICRQSPRLTGTAILPFQDVPAAVAEVNRSVTKLGLGGVCLSSYGLLEHMGSQTYWPIYEEMERLNVPLLFHNSRQGPFGDHRSNTSTLQHTIGRPIETLMGCAAIIYGGVPEKFPKLRVAFLENRAGWVPYWMDYMDAKFLKRPFDAPLLKAKPSEYMTGGNFFFAAEPEEVALPYAIERMGEDSIVFATDFPHAGGNFPYVSSTLSQRQDISEGAKMKILADNGKALMYGRR
jgi:predicted TIM-barrel fold metal-dependent hydrolase